MKRAKGISNGFKIKFYNRTVGAILLLFLLNAWSTLLFAQNVPPARAPFGFPFLQSYTSKDYRANGSNQAIIQDRRGLMYFGNEDGILEFDGNRWNLFKNDNKSFPKAMAIEEVGEGASTIRKPGRIYVGGIGEFGYLNVGNRGKLEYVSLVEKIPKTSRAFEDIFYIVSTSQGVIFMAFNRLFVLKSDRISVIDPELDDPDHFFHTIFSVNDEVYLRQWGKGLLQLKAGRLIPVPGGTRFAKERIYSMMSYANDTILMASRQAGLLLFDGQNYLPWPNQANQYLIDHQVYCGTAIGNEYFAFGTLRGGIVILDYHGRWVDLINKEKGLLNDLIFELFEDRDGNLWAGHTNGISHISWNVPFRVLDERSGLAGQGFSALISGGKLWLGTVQNLYTINWPIMANGSPTQRLFTQVPQLPATTMEIKLFKEQLLIAQTTGILAGKDEKNFTSLIRDRIVFTFQDLHKTPDNLLAGSNEGLIVVYPKGDRLSATSVEGFNESVYQLVEETPGVLWIGDAQKGIFRLQLSPDYQRVESLQLYDSNYGLPSNTNNAAHRLSDGLVFTTENGIYRYDLQKDRFLPDELYAGLLGPGVYIDYLMEDSRGDLWMWLSFSKDDRAALVMEMIRLKKVNSAEKYRVIKQPYKKINNIYRSLFPRIIELEPGYILFVSQDGFVMHEVEDNERPAKPFPVLIRKVEIITSGDTLLFGGALADEKGTPRLSTFAEAGAPLSHKWNDLRFSWTALSYVEPEKNIFRYKLNGFDKEWSSWSSLSFKDYTNLPAGTYQFRVAAINSLGVESDEAIYDFTIATPWYFSWWAVLLYTLLGGLTLWSIVQLNIRRLVLQQQRLEKIVRERTAEVQQQKTQIEAEKKKSDELLLNILPRQTAEELKQFGSAKAQRYESVSVLFADIKDFSTHARNMSPGELVHEIDQLFRAFDHLISQYAIEKIKTIGDAYMCAAGLPKKNSTHARDLVQAALDIQAYNLDRKEECERNNRPFFELRIGIHSGPVVAGIVGSKKYAYDIWGDTVNTAARIESSGLINQVNISGATYTLCKDHFECEHRGKINVKGLGEIDMYFVLKEI